MHDRYVKDAERMEQICEVTVNRCDIWQDRFVYWIAVALLHLLQAEIKRVDHEQKKTGY